MDPVKEESVKISATVPNREVYKALWETGEKKGELTLLTEPLGQLLNEQFPPEVWIVDKLIPDEAVTILAGFPGSFKTWLYMYIAVKVAKGQPVFGQYKTKHTNVLVFDEESGRRRLQNRFRQLGAPEDNSIHLMSRAGYKMNQLYANAIAQKAREVGAGLIVFDSFTRFNADSDENTSGDMAKLMDFYRQLADAGFAVLILHHNRKDNAGNFNAGQAMRGSTEIMAAVDCQIAVSRTGQSEIVKLEQTKNRDTWESAPIKLRFQLNASEFEFMGTDKTTAEKEADLLDCVLNLVRNNPGATQSALIAESKVIGIKAGEKAIPKLLKELERQEKVVIRPGSTPRGFSYHIAS